MKKEELHSMFMKQFIHFCRQSLSGWVVWAIYYRCNISYINKYTLLSSCINKEWRQLRFFSRCDTSKYN